MILQFSWPMLLAGYVGLWFYLKVRNGMPIQRWLSLATAALVAFLLCAIAIWWVWMPNLGGPMYLQFLHGPSVIAAIVVFASAFWWGGKFAT